MLETLSVDVLVPLAAVMLGAGVAAGLLAGLLGVGGGIVIVPVLFHLFDVIGVEEAIRMHLAVGTSLATIIPTSISSTRAHYRRAAVDLTILKSWGPGVLVGVALGAAIAAQLDGRALTGVFAVVALLIAANMAFRGDGWRLRETLPGGAALFSIGGVVGLLSSMMGIGGGAMSTPIMTACGVPIRRAVGTAAAIGLIIAVPGAIGFAISGLGVAGTPPLTLGYVSLVGFALVAPTTALVAPLGARLTHAIPPGLLRKAFALFLFATAVRMIYGLIS